MDNRDADKHWYENESRRKGLPSRCPYARDRDCPRFFLSREMMEGFQNNRNIDPEGDVWGFWNTRNLLPPEDDRPRASGSELHRVNEVENFCPEISFDYFGRFETDFAIHYHPYPIHYTECSEYPARKQDPNQPESLPPSAIPPEPTLPDSTPEGTKARGRHSKITRNRYFDVLDAIAGGKTLRECGEIMYAESSERPKNPKACVLTNLKNFVKSNVDDVWVHAQERPQVLQYLKSKSTQYPEFVALLEDKG